MGSGSGLFSLAARRLGAKVHSFDYDAQSVACTQEVKRIYFPDDSDWVIEEGSVLDFDYVKSLGEFDVVYAWGVLHHTGSMWEALGNVSHLVVNGGFLFLGIYNDQGVASLRWKKIKQIYNSSPGIIQFLIVLIYAFLREVRYFFIRLIQLQNPCQFTVWTEIRPRGMSRWHDLVDWIGGYPFEVAKPEEIFIFYSKKGFVLEQLVTCAGGLGCNQYVFAKKIKENKSCV